MAIGAGGFRRRSVVDIVAGVGPPDLEAFWSTTVAQLRDIPVDLRRSPRPAPSTGTVAFDLAFRSWGGHLLYGYAIVWDDRRPWPLVVHAHGYRSQAVP